MISDLSGMTARPAPILVSRSPGTPKVSVGLVVYNGGKFLSEAIESILNQTYTDLELIISDNASTDETGEICRACARQDNRVRYYRNDQNIGASANYTEAFGRARGEFFKWAAHDDVLLPKYIEKCVEILESDPTVVLCHSRTAKIDEHGVVKHEYRPCPDRADPAPHKRFRSAVRSGAAYFCWGLIRREALGKTSLMGPFASHDLPLVSQLSLHGRLFEYPEAHFLMRDHPSRSTRKYDFRKPRAWIEWYDPKLAGSLTFPTWRLLKEHGLGVVAAPISFSERLLCSGELFRWSLENRARLANDLVVATFRAPIVGPSCTRLYSDLAGRRWKKMSRKIALLIRSKTNGGETGPVILIDDDKLEESICVSLGSVPFIEQDGQYWGPAANSQSAIQELNRLRDAGAKFIAISKPAFWWLEFYDEFHSYLRTNFNCVLEHRLVVLFDLTKRPT